MNKLMNKARKNQKGFTLVELMVVVVIIGILVAIAIPLYTSVQANASNKAHLANIRTLLGAGSIALSEHPTLGTLTASNVWTSANGATDLGATAIVGTKWNNYMATWPKVPQLNNLIEANLQAELGVALVSGPATAPGSAYTVTFTGGKCSVTVLP